MDKTERNALVEQYAAGYDELLACLQEIPQDMWQFRPAEGEWSVHEIIVHLADSESNSALRARALVAEPGLNLMSYDQDKWAADLDYHSQDWQLALEGLKWARSSTYALIKDLPDETWQNTVSHAEYDQPFTFEQWLRIYANHVRVHIEQIKNNYKVWQEQQ